jgi:predicted transposase YbfD/YdcC
LVSAWARENRLTLGQVKVAAGSNEITAVPELLRALAIKGCVVTTDALNCQKEIAAEVRRRGADYVLALKGNHGSLHERVEQFLSSVRGGRTHGFEVGEHRSVEKGHGRIEGRYFLQVNAPEDLTGGGEWVGLASFGLCEAAREVGSQVSTHRRYYLSSLPVEAGKFAEAVRGHWAVGNSCHWVLDVIFGEDDSRVRVGHAAENFALLRRLVNNLLQHERSVKRGVKAKRLKAALDENYLLKVLRL